jgi:hypothetical protein
MTKGINPDKLAVTTTKTPLSGAGRGELVKTLQELSQPWLNI